MKRERQSRGYGYANRTEPRYGLAKSIFLRVAEPIAGRRKLGKAAMAKMREAKQEKEAAAETGSESGGGWVSIGIGKRGRVKGNHIQVVYDNRTGERSAILYDRNGQPKSWEDKKKFLAEKKKKEKKDTRPWYDR